MPLPNVSNAVARWAGSYTVKTVTRQTVDFVPADVVTSRIVQALVQPAKMEDLNPDQIDWSKEYLTVHSLTALVDGDLLEYEGEDFKIIGAGKWLSFGYMEVLAEQTKRPLVEVT